MPNSKGMGAEEPSDKNTLPSDSAEQTADESQRKAGAANEPVTEEIAPPSRVKEERMLADVDEPGASGNQEETKEEQASPAKSSAAPSAFRQRYSAFSQRLRTTRDDLSRRWRKARRRSRAREADKDARLLEQWSKWGRFRRWRRSRPFAGSILLILSGIIIVWGPASLIRLAMLPGSTIWAGLLVGALLVVMGIIQLLVPALSVITGAIGVVLAVISLIAASFGGLVVGMLLGIIGGALGVAWRPVTRKNNWPITQRRRVTTPARSTTK